MNQEEIMPFSVLVQSDKGTERISCWENVDGKCYVFLPSYAALANAQIIMETEVPVTVDGAKLKNGMSCHICTKNIAYNLTYDSFSQSEHKTLTFVQSANVATLFISTESGRTEYLHADKKNKESGFVSLYTSDGQLNYQGEAESISGRGNYTWENSDKKPYNIKLFQEANLLNMGFGRKWVLLANAHDSTLMRNKIVYDFANQIGMAYTPESQWVALYLNEEYRGLYMLCEAVDLRPQRFNSKQYQSPYSVVL